MRVYCDYFIAENVSRLTILNARFYTSLGSLFVWLSHCFKKLGEVQHKRKMTDGKQSQYSRFFTTANILKKTKGYPIGIKPQCVLGEKNVIICKNYLALLIQKIIYL
jgi:hypothetical protein